MDTLKQAVDATKSTKSNSSGRTPAWYNRQKNSFIDNMVTHNNPAVRLATLTSEGCPTTSINNALMNEKDQTIVKALLISNLASIKTLKDFVNTPMASNFDGDKEVEDIIVARIKGCEVQATSDPDEDDEDLFEDD